MDKSRILIADDERLILATMSMGLRDAGYEVIETDNGKGAVENCIKEQPDLAILDINMPGMTGIEAAQQIREQTGVPFMFLSAYGDDEIVQQAVGEGALGYLVKPVDVAKLIPSVKAALKRAADIDQLRERGNNLSTALESGRETSMAIGILMERFQLGEEQAFEHLRNLARRQRRKIVDVSRELTVAVEAYNQFSPGTDSGPNGKDRK